MTISWVLGRLHARHTCTLATAAWGLGGCQTNPNKLGIDDLVRSAWQGGALLSHTKLDNAAASCGRAAFQTACQCRLHTARDHTASGPSCSAEICGTSSGGCHFKLDSLVCAPVEFNDKGVWGNCKWVCHRPLSCSSSNCPHALAAPRGRTDRSPPPATGQSFGSGVGATPAQYTIAGPGMRQL